MASGEKKILPMYTGALIVTVFIMFFVVFGVLQSSQGSTPDVSQNLAGAAIDSVGTQSTPVQEQSPALGGFEFSVSGVESFTSIGYEDDLVTDEMFIKPTLVITNPRSEAQRVPDMSLMVRASANGVVSEHSRLENDGSYVEGVVRIPGWVRSDSARTTAAVFEVPADADSYALVVNSADGQLVLELDNIRDIGVDTSVDDRITELILLDIEDDEYYQE